MLLTVCIEAGRRTLTHTSWTGPTHGSRKWMSGQAAALAVLRTAGRSRRLCEIRKLAAKLLNCANVVMIRNGLYPA
jgi:hypothetical protein